MSEVSKGALYGLVSQVTCLKQVPFKLYGIYLHGFFFHFNFLSNLNKFTPQKNKY